MRSKLLSPVRSRRARRGGAATLAAAALAFTGFAAPAHAELPLPTPSPVPLPTQTPGAIETVTKSVSRNCSVTSSSGFADTIPLTFELTRPAIVERGHTHHFPLKVSSSFSTLSASLAVRGAVTLEGSISGLLFINAPGFSSSDVFTTPYGPSPVPVNGTLSGTDEIQFTLPAQGTSDGQGSILQKTTSIIVVARDLSGADVLEDGNVFNTGRFCETQADLGEELFTFPVAGVGSEPAATPTPTPVVTPTPIRTPIPPTPTPLPGAQYQGTLCVDPAPGAVPRYFEVEETTPTSIKVRYSLGFGCFPLPMAVTVELDGNVVQQFVGSPNQFSGSYTASGLEPGSTHRIKVTVVLPNPNGGSPQSPRVLGDREITALAPETTPTPTPSPSPSPTPVAPPLAAIVDHIDVSELTNRSVKLCFGDTVVPPQAYSVWVGGTLPVTQQEGCRVVTGLQPSTLYSVIVRGSGGIAHGQHSAETEFTTLASAPTPTPKPTATPVVPTPTPAPGSCPLGPNGELPTDQLITYSYALAGSATLKSLTKGSLPLSGGINARLCLPSGAFFGDLELAPATGNLVALGFLPVTAKVNLVPTEKVTGTLKSGKLTAVAKVRIKLPSVKTFGIELAGGANCQAKQISSITLTSTQATFLPLSGGPLAGTFDISDLSGCGFLTGIVSPLTKGSGNAIALNLTPRPNTP